MGGSRSSNKITLGIGAEDKFIEIFCEVFGPEKTANLKTIMMSKNSIYGRY